jgi:hypothetical protein
MSLKDSRVFMRGYRTGKNAFSKAHAKAETVGPAAGEPYHKDFVRVRGEDLSRESRIAAPESDAGNCSVQIERSPVSRGATAILKRELQLW